MILKGISATLAIDQIIINKSENYVHFLTHMDQCLQVPSSWSSIIYTSKHIALLLSQKVAGIPMWHFRILKENKCNLIKLPDGTYVTVIMFASGELRGNVMFYFEKDETNKIIYSGPVVQLKLFLSNCLLSNCVKSQIDELYVDNSRVASIHDVTMDSVAARLSYIFKTHPGYVILMNIPVFGYEDLVYLLATKYGYKVWVGPRICSFKVKTRDVFIKRLEDAEIVVGQQTVTEDELKIRFTQKQLTVSFINSYFEPANIFDKYGAYYIPWTPHPSLIELRALLKFIKPDKIKAIYEDMPPLPKFLTRLGECRDKSAIANANSSINVDTSDVDLSRIYDELTSRSFSLEKDDTNASDEDVISQQREHPPETNGQCFDTTHPSKLDEELSVFSVSDDDTETKEESKESDEGVISQQREHTEAHPSKLDEELSAFSFSDATLEKENSRESVEGVIPQQPEPQPKTTGKSSSVEDPLLKLDEELSVCSLSDTTVEEDNSTANHEPPVFMSQPVQKSSNHQVPIINLSMDSPYRATRENQKSVRLPTRVPLNNKKRRAVNIMLRAAAIGTSTTTNIRNASYVQNAGRRPLGTSPVIVGLPHKYKTRAFSQQKPTAIYFSDDCSSSS